MKETYITLTGTNHYYGKDFLKKGMVVRLKKEPDNEFDPEAIKITLDGVGKIGYVANSIYTVLGESVSTGRLYDRIGKKAKAEVVYILDRGVLCRVRNKDLSPAKKKRKKKD